MTSTSELGYYVTPYGTLDADAPMSSASARWYLNNIRHLIDESSQTRVNWVAFNVSGPASEGYNDEGITWEAYNTDWVYVASFVFPVCCIGTDTSENSYVKPVNLVVSIAGYTEASDELFFRAVIQPAYKELSYDMDNSRVLAYYEGSTTANTSEWVIDGVTTSLYPSNITNLAGKRKYGFTEHDGNEYDVSILNMRLTIYAKDGAYEGDGHLTGVYVREYQAR